MRKEPKIGKTLDLVEWLLWDDALNKKQFSRSDGNRLVGSQSESYFSSIHASFLDLRLITEYFL